MPITRALVVGTVAAALVAVLAPRAEAQPADHLKCFKVKDAKLFKSAQADLDMLQASFPDQSCTIASKAKELCVPLAKTNVDVEEGDDDPFAAQDLQFAQICYRLKCPSTDIAPLEVTDQFGTRDIEKFRSVRFCTPAVEQP